jgi:hypothetical protein
VRPVPAALAACALFVAPVALSAQPFNQQPLPPNARTVPPVKRPHPMPIATGGMHHPNSPHHSNGNRYGTSYPIVIDGSVLNRYLATPTPAPKHTPATHHTNNGQDVFETHSTDDAK